MKYQVTFACGHEGRVDLFGKNSEREYKLEQFARNICPECAAAQRAKKEEASGLPELKGSEKQVAWATRIRQNIITEFAGWRKKDYEAFEALNDKTKEQVDGLFEAALKQTQATFWINNSSGVFTMLETM
jgi:hypothetical protein